MRRFYLLFDSIFLVFFAMDSLMNIPTDSRGSLVESPEVAEGFQGTFRQKSDRKTEIYYVCIYLLFDSIFLVFFTLDCLMTIPTDPRGSLVESLEVAEGSQGTTGCLPTII